MKVEFLKEYSAKTAAGEIRTVAVGTVLNLSPDKAARLVASGVVVEVDSIPALWKWFVSAANCEFQSRAISPEAWEMHKNHRNKAVCYFDQERIPDARRELENALCALRGVAPVLQTDYDQEKGINQ